MQGTKKEKRKKEKKQTRKSEDNVDKTEKKHRQAYACAADHFKADERLYIKIQTKDT